MSDTLNILSVQASGRTSGSVTRQLTNEFTTALANTGRAVRIVERDLTHGIPFVDGAWIEANFTAPEERTADHSAALGFSDTLIEEVEDADVIVIGAPIYNFGPPASLKAWIDQIARARRTFRYTPDGPEGLLTGKSAVLISASGGVGVDTEFDFATPYLRHALGFVGIRDVSVIAADKLMMGADDAYARGRTALADLVDRVAGGRLGHAA